jgi:hypothetical protein
LDRPPPARSVIARGATTRSRPCFSEHPHDEERLVATEVAPRPRASVLTVHHRAQRIQHGAATARLGTRVVGIWKDGLQPCCAQGDEARRMLRELRAEGS